LIKEVDLTESGANAAMAWDTSKRVAFSIPFQNQRISIFMDEMLPRIVDLAEGANDRQTKVAACELLHSIILLTIGRNTQHDTV